MSTRTTTPAFPYTNVVTGNGCAPIEGQQLQRQPKLRYMLTPSYRLPLGCGEIEAYVTYTHVGDHTQDQSGLQQLGTYETWDFGITANVGENWQFALRGTNVTDELGLTESNSRIFGVAADTGGVLLARPLEGQRDQFPGEVSLVALVRARGTPCSRAARRSIHPTSAPGRPNGSMR